jgi:RNA-directed DNA polymerase
LPNERLIPMIEIFTKNDISAVYCDLKRKKKADRNKSLPIGIDGVSTSVFERNYDFSLNEIHRKLKIKNGRIDYKFAPLLRIERSKSQGGVRVLHIPRLRDQIVLRLLHNEIKRLAEIRGIDLNLKSPYSFVNRFNQRIEKNENAIILKTDISKFYDSIPRKEAVQLCLELGIQKELFEFLVNWSQNLKVQQSQLYADSEFEDFQGLPQGLSLSSLLAELYVRQVDQNFLDNEGYFRYIDDIVVVCRNNDDAEGVLEQLKHSIERIGLKLSPCKTEILRIQDGVEWLGLFHCSGKRFIHPDKLKRALRPINLMRNECMQSIQIAQNENEKKAAIDRMIKQVDNYTSGHRKVRLKWYSLVEDRGQWKIMDKYIHGLIRSCLRKVGFDLETFNQLPSIHAKILSYKSIKESQNSSIKDNAPSV